MKRRPSYQVYHNAGEAVAPQLPVNYSYADIARLFHCKRQKVYHEVMVALGKVVVGLRRGMEENQPS